MVYRSLGLVLAAFFVATPPAIAQSQGSGEMFDPTAVVAGIQIDRAACAALERDGTAVWVEADGRSTCMRYYAAGLKAAPGPNPVAALWMNGDVLGSHGHDASRRQSGFGPSQVIEQERQLAARFAVPSIYLGRPGTYGSAGEHFTMRGRTIEAKLIDATLDALKRRYGIVSWSLGGHSGGGTLVAEMLTRRRDIRCAVISSGVSSYRAYLEAHGMARGERLTRFDPSASLDRVSADPGRRAFVIGDPRETNVPFATQRLFYDGLVARGHAAVLVALERATDPRHHDLVDFGETATEMCAAGDGTDAIVSALKAMPDPPPRLTN